jgi:hypothetical protein
MEVYPIERVKSLLGLFIPVMHFEKSDKEAPGSSVQDLDTSAKEDQDSVNSLYLKIGDKAYNYQDLVKYRIHTDAFDVTFPDNAIFGVMKGGVSKVVADGFYIITEPLQKAPIQFISNPVYFVHTRVVQSLICPRYHIYHSRTIDIIFQDTLLITGSPC